MLLEAASQDGDRAEPQALRPLSPLLRARTPWGRVLGNGARWYWERPWLLILLSSGQSGSQGQNKQDFGSEFQTRVWGHLGSSPRGI